MDAFRQDLRHALRRLAHSPGFTVVALLTLALGIGANTAIFTVVNAVLLRPLPFDHPEQLVGLFHRMKGDTELSTMSPPNFLDVRAANHTMVDVAALNTRPYTLTGSGAPVRIAGAEVSASFFNVLRVPPILGRTFRSEENEPGRNQVVVLAHRLWVQRFGGDSGVVGRTITIDAKPHTVIGVMPAGFSYPDDRALWVPFEYDNNFRADNRGAWYIEVFGRVKNDATASQAAADVEAIARRLERQYPKSNTDLQFTAAPLHGWIVDRSRTALLLLLGAVGFVLLIACVNVANLTLARSAAREGELAVRSALGAGRLRLVRQLLTESVVLSIAGGVAGLLIAIWGSDALVTLQPAGIPRIGEVRVDGSVVAFTAIVAVVTGLLFGSIPAFQVTRVALVGALKEGGRNALTGRRGHRVRSTLVVAELALAVGLLAGAGLLINSFVRIRNVDPGFQTGEALTFGISLPESTYKERAQRVAFYDRLHERINALPGVQSTGAVMGVPLSDLNFNISFAVEGRPAAPVGHEPTMEVRVASAGYFGAIGIPLKRGRLFTPSDVMNAPQVVLLSESAVRKYFPTEDPLGRNIKIGWTFDEGRRRAGGTVVGVVGDVKDAGLDAAARPEIYLPYAQMGLEDMTVVVRGDLPASSLSRSVEDAVRDLDANLPVANMKTLDQIVSASVADRRFYMLLIGLFAAVALVLAAVGIFGVMSYAVTQQTREIGIRMALGADRRDVVRMVLRHAGLLILSGLVVGVGLALAAGRALSSMLFDLSPGDPATLAAVAALLATIALVASYLPARRATRIDPVIALRAE
jgi:putative ABC transport system permease protein